MKNVYFNSCLLEFGLSLNEALVFSHISFHATKKQSVRTFKKSLATYLLISKDTVRTVLQSLCDKQLITTELVDETTTGREKYRLKIELNYNTIENDERLSMFVDNIKRVTGNKSLRKLNLICVDLSIIQNSMQKYTRSSQHLHRAIIAYAILKSLTTAKQRQLQHHKSRSDFVTLDIKYRVLMHKLKVCLNTAKAIVRTLIDSQMLQVTSICSTTRELTVQVKLYVNQLIYSFRQLLTNKKKTQSSPQQKTFDYAELCKQACQVLKVSIHSLPFELYDTKNQNTVKSAFGISDEQVQQLRKYAMTYQP